MRVLILGGTGVLSTSITQECLNKGYDVVTFNRKKTKSNLQVKTINGNRNNEEDLKRLLNMKPDVVIDMLCFNRNDAVKTINIFREQIEQYIYCSTSCIYTPKNNKEVISESSLKNPRSEYGRNKLEAENEFIRADKKSYFNTTIFRPGHVFNKNFIVNNLTLNGLYLLERIKNNLDLILTEQGEKQWQACHADNIGRVFSRACGNSKCYSQVYNISGEEVFTWNDIYNILITEMNSKSRIVYMKSEDIMRSKYNKEVDFLKNVTRYNWNHDISLLKDHIGDFYKKNFIQGIKEVIDNNTFKNNNDYIESAMYKELLMKK